jgi:hypothetical protein
MSYGGFEYGAGSFGGMDPMMGGGFDSGGGYLDTNHNKDANKSADKKVFHIMT